ncbi:cleavage and polyadenylation specificity factor subunit 5-like [Pyrus ussuriensis x Pyrus communis]|uniref:Pre-mRNA cleavage factor Im 25 kDa subunit n=1 Tax=Pyrus ussuriensis x Pyrus communis TaxID=2448454 RepID=A0A5N5FM65_9ROSA|nr:cleavage and polyadenylation specificity factor subunit 5-like [Pyrus ussuriensis x Pyrus communis]
MGDERGSSHVSDSNSLDHHDNDDQSRTLDIYPLSSYYFASKEAIPVKDETPADRLHRLKSKYLFFFLGFYLLICVFSIGFPLFFINFCLKIEILILVLWLLKYSYAAYGLRTCVEAVILVELFKHPHVLLLQIRNCIFKLPGGRLRPGESEIDGLKRKLSRKLCINADGDGIPWEVGECLGVWWRHDFETLLCRDLPPRVENPKECTKLFIVKLPDCRKFIAPKNQKLLAIPLCQIAKNNETYGPVISGVPDMLSTFTINIVDD